MILTITCKYKGVIPGCKGEYTYDHRSRYRRTVCDNPACEHERKKDSIRACTKRSRTIDNVDGGRPKKTHKAGRVCSKCGAKLSVYNRGPLCHACDGRACGLLGRESRDEFTIRQNR